MVDSFLSRAPFIGIKPQSQHFESKLRVNRDDSPVFIGILYHKDSDKVVYYCPSTCAQ